MTQGTPNRVEQSRDGDILVLTINNPPVNAFGPGVPEGLKAGLDAAAADDSVKAVVIIGGCFFEGSCASGIMCSGLTSLATHWWAPAGLLVSSHS